MGSLNTCPLPPLPPPRSFLPPSPPHPFWPHGPPPVGWIFCGGGFMASPPCVTPLPSVSISTAAPSPPAFPAPYPAPSVICWASCGVAKVWPLCVPPPSGKLTIRSMMALACSSVVPLPPNGIGAPSPTLVPLWAFPLTPSLSLHLAVGGGGLLRSWGLPSISCIRPLTKVVCAC